MKYEDMKANPYATVHSVVDFIGVTDVTEELIQKVVHRSSFTSMKKDSSSNYSWKIGPNQILAVSLYARVRLATGSSTFLMSRASVLTIFSPRS